MPEVLDTVADDRINEAGIQEELEEFFQAEDEIQQEVTSDVFDSPFRVENIPIANYCTLNDITLMKMLEVDVDPSPAANQVLLAIPDSIGNDPVFSHLFLANRDLVIPHIQGVTPVIKIRTDNGKLINSGFEILEMTEPIDEDGYRCTLFCYVPFMTGKKIFAFGLTKDYTHNQRFFSVGFCKEDEMIPTFEIPPMVLRPLDERLEDNDKIICSNTSARFRKMSAVWENIGAARGDLNEMLNCTIDPNYMEKIMILNMFFTVPNAIIDG